MAEPQTDERAPVSLEAPARRFSRKDAERWREQRDGLWEFSLDATAPGTVALVKRLTLQDRATIAELPATLQTEVLTALSALTETQDARNGHGGGINRVQFLKNMAANEEAINAYCVVGFVEPPVIFSDEDRTDETQVVVTDIDIRDRRAYMLGCDTEDAEAASRFRRVLPGEQAAATVEADGPRVQHQPAAKRAARVA